MKKIILIIAFLLGYLANANSSPVLAHLEAFKDNSYPNYEDKLTGLRFIISSYKNASDLDILFANSTRVLEYLEGEEVQKPTFLGLVTEGQENNLKIRGFEMQTIDTNTNLSRYRLLYHPEPNKSTDELKEHGEIFVISPNIVLLKLAPGKTVTHEELAQTYFDMPFPSVVPTPAFREEIGKTSLRISPTQKPTSPLEEKTNPLVLIFAVVLIVLVAAGTYFLLKKRSNEKSPPPNLPTDNPPLGNPI